MDAMRLTGALRDRLGADRFDAAYATGKARSRVDGLAFVDPTLAKAQARRR